MLLVRRPSILAFPVAQELDLLPLGWPGLLLACSESFTYQPNVVARLQQQSRGLDTGIGASEYGAEDCLLYALANAGEAMATHQDHR